MPDLQPGSTPETRPVTAPPPAGLLRRVFDVREWRVRTKLTAVLAIPTATLLVLTGISLTTLALDARDYSADARAASLGRHVSALSHELQRERDLTSGVYVFGDDERTRALADQQAAVDRAVRRYNQALNDFGTPTGRIAKNLDEVEDDVNALPLLREAVRSRSITHDAAISEYGSSVSSLIQVVRSISGGSNEQLIDAVRSLDAFSRYKERASQTRARLYALALRKRLGTGDYEALTGALANENAAAEQFLDDALPEERELVDDTIPGQSVLAVSRMETAALRGAAADGKLDLDAEQWLAASTNRIEQMHEVETRLLNRVVSRSEALGNRAARQAMIAGAAILGAILLSLLFSFVVARSMARQLSRLRRGALDVAHVRLPDVVERLRTMEARDDVAGGDEDAARDAAPLGIHSRDEVGQVAAAFQAVHRQAVRLATEQAMMRRNVNALFVNFSRRSQSLVERQLRLIDELESREQDPDVLENLFRLDHLATRMRRNNESLLVIAGNESTRRWSEPVPLTDVVLAAISEIEQFTRVTQQIDGDIAVAGHAVSDIVHLLAELLENATRSSPPSTRVVVATKKVRSGSGALLEIEDAGIGMPGDALVEANRRLEEKPDTYVPAGPRMGLFVVSRLAHRYGISVSLVDAPRGGVIAQVRLPASLASSATARTAAPARPDATPARPDAAPARPDAAPASSESSRAGLPARLPSRTPAATAPQKTPQKALPAAHRAPATVQARAGTQTTQGSSDQGSSDQGTHPPAARPDGAGLPGGRRLPGGAVPTSTTDEMPTVLLPVFDSVSQWFQSRPETAEGAQDSRHGDTPSRTTGGRRAVDSGAPIALEGVSGRNRPGTLRAPSGDGHGSPPVTAESRTSVQQTPMWGPVADAGHAAAEAAVAPQTAGLTRSGLPIRRPQAHFVPGSPAASVTAGKADIPTSPPVGGNGSDRTLPVRGARPAPDRRGTDGAAGGHGQAPAPVSPQQVQGVLSSFYRGVRQARDASAPGVTSSDHESTKGSA